MENKLFSQCEREILERLADAGPKGLNKGGLRLPGKTSERGKACWKVLNRLLNDGEVGNLGTPKRPCYVTREHFKPLEIAYEHIENCAREAGVRLGSKRALLTGLSGAAKKKFDEALKLLVAEGVLIRLKWAGKPVYLHVSALPQTASVKILHPPTKSATPEIKTPDADAIRRAYQEAVNIVGYPDVLIHEVFLCLGGALEPFKQALLEACRSGWVVPSVGDWALVSPEERQSALLINGQPHLQIRIKE
ncbi:MAG: hypothetical protein GXP09_09360 [Gammaproteobacteria bacterium]|nr:hypothetical protein [Gammaproteobacteria bacterium]